MFRYRPPRDNIRVRQAIRDEEVERKEEEGESPETEEAYETLESNDCFGGWDIIWADVGGKDEVCDGTCTLDKSTPVCEEYYDEREAVSLGDSDWDDAEEVCEEESDCEETVEGEDGLVLFIFGW